LATDRTKALLLEHEQFAQLDVDEQRRRIAEYIADWYDPDCKLNTVDNVRFSQRLRSHAVKACIGPGPALEIILPQARRHYETGVFEREASRIREEDRRQPEDIPVGASFTDTRVSEAVPVTASDTAVVSTIVDEMVPTETLPSPAPSRPRSRSNRVK
jgi:hypothetical protein